MFNLQPGQGLGFKGSKQIAFGLGRWVLDVILYSLPRCITRRLEINMIKSRIPFEAVVRRSNMETTVARTAVGIMRRKKEDVVTRKPYRDLVFRDVKPCKT